MSLSRGTACDLVKATGCHPAWTPQVGSALISAFMSPPAASSSCSCRQCTTAAVGTTLCTTHPCCPPCAAVPMPGRHRRPWASLNNKCMELRKVGLGAQGLRLPAAPQSIISVGRTASLVCCARSTGLIDLCPAPLYPRPLSGLQPPAAELPAPQLRCGRPHRAPVRQAGYAGPHPHQASRHGAQVRHIFCWVVKFSWISGHPGPHPHQAARHGAQVRWIGRVCG